MSHTDYRLPAEWETQSATLLAWPAANSDWRDRLENVRSEYRTLIETILAFQPAVLLHPADEDGPDGLPERPDLHRLPLRYNDTWCRDYGPITLVFSGYRLALDFHFDGWGGKYPASLDNRVNTHLSRHDLFERMQFRQYLFELEGGAIDSDGRGRLLVNWHCLRARNPHLSEREIDFELHNLLNIDKVMGLDLEPMTGDDTDGHIDTLARFTEHDTIVFQTQSGTERSNRLRGQLEELRTRDDEQYRLIALPWPDDLDHAQPASYANFLFVNGGCLVPAYGSRHDERARDILAELLPERKVVSVPAATMITQSGGPHCATMHIPAALG
ncbi:agmatine deiminase family protein [Wenzhouxiangella sp. EGI_FJ10305]|uniref:agmatine deiminase family protein n=1 Tax=Wenzhouxiangella sp. EGI_FJ10305 TaxID=3243768 RepID=UPI0035DD46D2